MSKYFYVLEMFQRHDLQKMHEAIRAFLESSSGQKKKYIRWTFDQVVSMVSQRPDSPQKTLLLTYIRVLNGEISTVEARRILSTSQ